MDGGVLAAKIVDPCTIYLGSLSGSGGTLSSALTGSAVTYQIRRQRQRPIVDRV